MSFNAFMEWIRNFFSSRSRPNTGTGNSTVETPPADTTNTTTPNTPVAPPEEQPSPPPITEEEIAEVIEPWLLVAITVEAVWFNNGEQYQLGESIDYGPYEGKTVDGVDISRRRCSVGGVSVRLRSTADVRLRNHAIESIRKRRNTDIR